MMRGMNAITGQELQGTGHVAQSIADILGTPKGTRVGGLVKNAYGQLVHVREYGSQIPYLIDKPVTPRLVMQIYAETAIAIDQWEPCFELDQIRNASFDKGHLKLHLDGFYLPDGQRISLEGINI